MRRRRLGLGPKPALDERLSAVQAADHACEPDAAAQERRSRPAAERALRQKWLSTRALRGRASPHPLDVGGEPTAAQHPAQRGIAHELSPQPVEQPHGPVRTCYVPREGVADRFTDVNSTPSAVRSPT